MKHYSQDQIAEVVKNITQAAYVVVDIDFSSYDSSQTEMCKEIESMVVRKCAPR